MYGLFPPCYNKLQKLALDRIESVLDRLNIPYVQQSSERINILCPVHGSTKVGSSCIYLSNGNYKCWSRSCEDNIGPNFVHLVKWALSEDVPATWEEVGDFLQDEKFTIREREIVSKPKEEIFLMDECKYPSVTIPSKYFMDRGFSPEVLTKFHVGNTEEFPYNGRALVPIKSEEGKLMGFSGRATCDKCSKCNFYHSRYQSCIDKNYKYAHMFNKWFHSPKLKKTLTLYGVEFIPQGCKKIALVEGPSCVWKLYEVGIPAVAVLGKSFSEAQAKILKRRGVEQVFALSDEDEAGQLFRSKFITDWHTVFQIYQAKLSQKDVSEMSDGEIQEIVVKRWNLI